MGGTDIIVISVLVLVVGAAVVYMVKAKKSGKKCIGCPYSGSCCSENHGSCGGCRSQDKE